MPARDSCVLIHNRFYSTRRKGYIYGRWATNSETKRELSVERATELKSRSASTTATLLGGRVRQPIGEALLLVGKQMDQQGAKETYHPISFSIFVKI